MLKYMFKYDGYGMQEGNLNCMQKTIGLSGVNLILGRNIRRVFLRQK